jgi:hypothetical protein
MPRLIFSMVAGGNLARVPLVVSDFNLHDSDIQLHIMTIRLTRREGGEILKTTDTACSIAIG